MTERKLKVNRLLKEENLKSLVFHCVLFWPFLYVLTTLSPIPISLVAFLICGLLFLWLYRYDKKTTKLIVWVIAISLISQLVVLIMDKSPYFSFVQWLKYYVKYLTFIIFGIIATNKLFIENLIMFAKKNMVSTKLFIYFTVVVLAILGGMYFTGIGFQMEFNELRYQGFFYNAHVFTYFLISLISVVFFIALIQKPRFSNKEKYVHIAISIAILLLSFASGARAPFLIVLIIFLLFGMYYFEVKITAKLSLTVMMVVFVIFCVLAYMNYLGIINNVILDKTLLLFTRPDKFLNSRDIMMSVSFNYMKDTFGIINWLFGDGFGVSTALNMNYFGRAIWTHNDIIEVFLSGGIVSLLTYLYVMYKYFVKSKNAWFPLIFLFLAIFNGLFIYQEVLFTLPIIAYITNTKWFDKLKLANI